MNQHGKQSPTAAECFLQYMSEIRTEFVRTGSYTLRMLEA